MTYDPQPAAALLARAWKTGTQLEALPEGARPANIDEGYALQEAFIAASGEPVAGWKLGVGSPAGIRMTGLGAPLAGRVTKPRLHENGAAIRIPNAAPVTVEFEVAFVMGRDVPPEALLLEPLEAVAEIRTTFELVLSRFVNRRAVGWPSFAGDSVGFEALVVGGEIDADQMTGIAREVVLTVDGAEVARGLEGDELTNPVIAFENLLVHARERGKTLRKGEILTLGAIGKPFDVAGEVRVEAAYFGKKLGFSIRRP